MPSTGGHFLRKNKHTEKEQFFRNPGKFQAAFFCQLGHIDAVGRHTADLLLRMGAGFIVDSLTGVAQGATAITQAKAIDTFLAKSFCKTKNGSIVSLLGLLDFVLVVVAADLPNGLEHQRTLTGFQPLLHLLYCTAVRRTGIVGIVFAAKVVLTELPEG